MSGMYPILWAMKHAPTADVYEQAVLIQMADSADEDGHNAYVSKRTIAARIPGDTSEETVRRKWRALEKRGLIRPDATPAPPRYLNLPKQYRTKRWEICIPYSWWSDAQREQIQRNREDRGLGPLTPENRPDLAPPPAAPARSDKGKPRPERRKKSQAKPSAAGGTVSAPSPAASGGTDSGPQGALTVDPRGHSQWPNPPGDLPGIPSSPPAPPDTETTPAASGTGGGEDHQDHTEHAQSLVDAAVARWASGHRAPGPNDRQRLVQRVAAELAAGGQDALILDELTRDLGDARSAVRVVLGARTRTPGWGVACDPRPDAERYTVTGPRPEWCGICDQRTRLVAGQARDGSERLWRCRRCHPDADPEPEPAEQDAVPRCPDHPAQPWLGCGECAPGADAQAPRGAAMARD